MREIVYQNRVLGPAPACKKALDRKAVVHHILEDVTGTESGRLVNAAENMSRTVRKRQTPKGPARASIFERAAISLPIIQAHQPFAPRRHGTGLGIQDLVDIP